MGYEGSPRRVWKRIVNLTSERILPAAVPDQCIAISIDIFAIAKEVA